ncbi:MAG TPA: hemerythrin domain-containing protein [Pseudonocardiaceae bacterium]|nr:hemerythrin domain-containing protein [Pseudonocardiaceae bacterium]
MTATAQSDLVTALLDEHRALESRMELLQGDTGGDREKMMVDLLTETHHYGRTVQDHLDPLVRRYLPDGAARADHVLVGHIEVARVVAELRRHRPSDAMFDDLLGRLISQLRNHLAEQEHELLPRLREHVPADVLRQRGMLAARGGRDPSTAPLG